MSARLVPVVGLFILGACTASPDAPQRSTAGPSRTAGTPVASATPSDRPTATTSGPAAVSGSATATAPPALADARLDLPLIEAADKGETQRVARLLRRGASVQATDSRGRTPLVAAAYGNHVEAARVLLDAGADPDVKDATVQSAFLIATSEVGDDPELLDLLLANGADVNSRDSFNGTGLIRAADRGFPAIIERLLETNIPVDHVNRLGWTALHEAIILGDGSADYIAVVRLLIDAGADVNLPSTRDDVTPLRHAIAGGHDEIADLLREAGATR